MYPKGEVPISNLPKRFKTGSWEHQVLHVPPRHRGPVVHARHYLGVHVLSYADHGVGGGVVSARRCEVSTVLGQIAAQKPVVVGSETRTFF